jgi:hypothetical protein
MNKRYRLVENSVMHKMHMRWELIIAVMIISHLVIGVSYIWNKLIMHFDVNEQITVFFWVLFVK